MYDPCGCGACGCPVCAGVHRYPPGSLDAEDIALLNEVAEDEALRLQQQREEGEEELTEA
jgi:GAF domain-containing protein